MQLRELARLNGTLREDDNRWVHQAAHWLAVSVQNAIIQSNVAPIVVGSSVLGRTLSRAASPTPHSVPNVVELVTFPLTASTPGNVQKVVHAVAAACRCLTRVSVWLCSSFAGQRAAGGEPPQSAQDKARMDKEYLSLMAELGEAPVPSSGGGHSSNQSGAMRGSGPSSNQPPPVSLGHQMSLLWP